MRWFFDVVSLVGIADSVWMALDPRGWSGFWGQVLAAVPRDRRVAIALALAEFGFSVTLLRWNHQEDESSRLRAPVRESDESPGRGRRIGMRLLRRKAA